MARGLARMFYFLASEANSVAQPNNYQFNPATSNYGCSDGSQVQSNGTCVAPATKVYYDAGATSCTSPPCAYTFDGNNDGQMIFSNDGSNEQIYTGGPFVDALVATGSPTATAPTGPTGVLGLTYKNIVQNFMRTGTLPASMSGIRSRQSTVCNGNTRGGGDSGGGWLYDCQQGDDNSTSAVGSYRLYRRKSRLQ